MRIWLLRIGTVLGLALVVMSFVNASWVAGTPRGTVKLIALRGVAQQYDRTDGDDTCTATRIEEPYHTYLENTPAAMTRAHGLAAAMVALDLAPTKDGRLVVFHDPTLDCRTDGKGKVGDHTLAELEQLDAGYGYTADGGKTFPFRGKGKGMIQPIEQFLRYAEKRALLFSFSGSDPKEAELLAAALKAAGRDPVAVGDGFYGLAEKGPVARIRELYPKAWVFSEESAQACSDAYVIQGWLGVTPEACRNGTLMIPLDRQWTFAGWPNRAIARMEAVGARIVVVGPQGDGDGPRGLDLPEQLSDVPASFNGYLLIDDIWTLGPALHPRIDRRTERETARADAALERRRARDQ